MQLWYSRCPLPTASGIAIDRGMLDDEFRRDGITVLSLDASSDAAIREAHFDHGQKNLFRQGGNIPPIWSRSRGADTVVVAINRFAEYQAIIAMPNSGIREPADLKGRRLGLPRRVNEQIDYWRAMCLAGFHAALEIGGLSTHEVTFVDLLVEEKQIARAGTSDRGILFRGAARARRQSREALALARGEVDAIYTASAPGAFLTAFLGAEEVVDLGRHPDPWVQTNNQIPTILTVSRSLAKSAPEIVARYLRTLFDAAAWAADHPREAQAIIGADVGATAEWVTASNGPIHAELEPTLDEEGLALLARQKSFLLSHGFIDRDFDTASWVDPVPLRRALAMHHDRVSG